ncbi:hypothetical protein CANARDRAFT_209768 [[Candida] arabinofermentans NRRL YB-2248]|uniref:Histone deacetylase n=1 Tax=[Candida] arabinofermentans NRRL YB-2248 TaxID=983967 RepID=A0A1E4ST45_9ASCO|nr:hypothetical protein CANARDRAFT_209768 [[Candida] arabinofermentans NRRL YB-2248]
MESPMEIDSLSNGNNIDSTNEEKVEDGKQNGLSSIDPRDVIVPIKTPELAYVPLKTGLCYDVRMRYHAKIFTSYFEYIDPHPEDPRRIYRIYKILAENGLISDPTLSGRDDIGDYMLKIPVREATKEEILLVHTEDHLKYIESTQSMTKEELLKETEKGDSVYFNNDSLLSAKLSCGGAIEASKAVVEGKVKNALAVVRPPGHHAEPDAPGGFCLFSNVAVAAKAILTEYPESVRRIIIVDWDVHHGNGTQKAFLDDPRVLYISLHRYEQGKYYPGTKAGGADQVGIGAGEGFNVNVPWPVGGMGDADYIYAFRKVIMPICYEFNPDLVIISSGFDAADGDVIGGCHVSPAGYGHMTHYLKSLAKGNLCVVLEGGYNLDSIAKSALRVAKVLLGEPPEELVTVIPKTETVEVIEDVIRIQSRYWKTLKPGYYGQGFSTPTIMGDYEGLLKSETGATTSTTSNTAAKATTTTSAAATPSSFEELASKNSKLNDSIRSQQTEYLFQKHKFINLPILSSKQSSISLDKQVMASPDIYKSEKIVIIVHDPSRVWARKDTVTGTLDTSNAVIVDQSIKFIDWAVKENYGLIDINIPLNITGENELQYNNINTSQDVLLYLWDNYIQYFKNVTQIAFIGVGDSYNGIVHLCGHRDVRSLVKACVCVIDKTTSLRAIVSSIDESVVDWFYRNSLIFTSLKHPCWGDAVEKNDGSLVATGTGNEAVGGATIKRPRKKYGRVLRADVENLDGILDERFEEACEFIMDSIEDYDSESESD